MNILPQILKNASKNLLVNHFVVEFKKKIDHFLERLCMEMLRIHTLHFS